MHFKKRRQNFLNQVEQGSAHDQWSSMKGFAEFSGYFYIISMI